MVKNLLSQRLLALFMVCALVFNFPLLRLWMSDATWLGLPLGSTALFIAWALLIGILASLMERSGTDDNESP